MPTKDGRWKMETPCDTCPFATSGPGLELRQTLRPGRWYEILTMLARGQEHFTCHKTTGETGNGTNLICAGAMALQHKHGLTSNYERVCERIDGLRQTGQRL